MKKKLMKVSTVPESLDTFCRGQLRWLSEYYDVVAVSSPMKELKDIEEREGVRCVAVPMERHISLWKDLRSLWAMIRLMHREKPDIVHSMTPKAGLISMISAWVNRVPVRMHTYTGLVFPTAHGLLQKVLIMTDRVLCFCANYINPEGQGVANDLKRFHITRKPLHIIGNGNVRGIDPEYWRPSSPSPNPSHKGRGEQYPAAEDDTTMRKALRQRYGVDKDAFVFTFVGRLVGDKGINELVSAFTRLKTEDSRLQLVLVGPYEDDLDPLRPETMERIKSDENIITVGAQSDVRPFYQLADAFVFPSYREGFPNTVLEAGAMGLPQIVTDINGANEIIKDGLNGKIIQPRNEAALYEAMSWFISHPAELQRMRRNARRMILERYSQKYLWNELLKTYLSFERQ